MKTSQIIFLVLMGLVTVYTVKQLGLLSPSKAPSPQTVTNQQSAGSQNTVPKDDFQSAVQGISSVFASAVTLFGGSAQTSAKTA